MRRISSKRCSVYRARLFDNDRFLVGGALVVIFVRKAEGTVPQLNERHSRSVSDKPHSSSKSPLKAAVKHFLW